MEKISNAHDDAINRLLDCMLEVYEKMKNDYCSIENVFNPIINGIPVKLTLKHHISSDYTFNLFRKGGFTEKHPLNKENGRWIEEKPTKETAEKFNQFKTYLKNHSVKKEKKVIVDEPETVKLEKSETTEHTENMRKALNILLDDFLKQYKGAGEQTKKDMLTHLNVLYESKNNPKTKQNLFIKEEENKETHILEMVDIRDRFNPKCSAIIIKELYEELNYFQIIDNNLYQWIERKPDEEMVKQVHKNTFFNRYFAKHYNYFLRLVEEMDTPVVEENMHSKITENVKSLTEIINASDINDKIKLNDDPVNLTQFENLITTPENKTASDTALLKEILSVVIEMKAVVGQLCVEVYDLTQNKNGENLAKATTLLADNVALFKAAVDKATGNNNVIDKENNSK